MPLPRRVLSQGITDIVRISDGRTSGTAYETVVLHVTPEEAAVNGTIALVRTGDVMELLVRKGRLQLHLSDADLERRKLS